MFMNAAGVISTTQLRQWRRGAILAIAIIAAVITPSSDPYTMLAMAVPMWLLYELAIIVGRIRKR
jgi:sec-independent protein translocase protein TatC